jgi:hypothetical protein
LSNFNSLFCKNTAVNVRSNYSVLTATASAMLQNLPFRDIPF